VSIFKIKMSIIRIYTDGAAKGNPGPGGFGVVMKFKDQFKEFSQGFRLTTNNRMELLAVIHALEQLKSPKYPIELYSDSKYVVDSVSKGWVFGWRTKGFKGKKNVDLWMRYLELHNRYQITFHWVKGHNGHPENERCDQLAVMAAESNELMIDAPFENEQSGTPLFKM
jgi:ribonuclease HI